MLYFEDSPSLEVVDVKDLIFRPFPILLAEKRADLVADYAN